MMLPSDTNNDTDMFPPNVFDPSKHCLDKFGVKYRKEWMKIQYWGTGKVYEFLQQKVEVGKFDEVLSDAQKESTDLVFPLERGQ